MQSLLNVPAEVVSANINAAVAKAAAKKTITIMVLMAIGKIFFSDFGLFYQVPMNSGALYGVTQTIDTFVYRGLMELNDVGMSSAAGLFQSCVGFVLVITANALVRKMNPENALF